jgi:uncharacterized protein YjbI with pentapeptide repeats
MSNLKPQCRPPPLSVLRSIYDHQRWLTSNGRFGKRFNREALEFENCDFDGVELSGANLAFARFIGGTLRGARFLGATLSDARFISCDVEGANFTGAELVRATFATNHEGASFEGANLQQVAWSEEEAGRRDAELKRRIARSIARAEPR